MPQRSPRRATRFAVLSAATVAGANGSFGGLRREINWDGVPDARSDPNPFPADFFNTTSPRGAVFSHRDRFSRQRQRGHRIADPVRIPERLPGVQPAAPVHRSQQQRDRRELLRAGHDDRSDHHRVRIDFRGRRGRGKHTPPLLRRQQRADPLAQRARHRQPGPEFSRRYGHGRQHLPSAHHVGYEYHRLQRRARRRRGRCGRDGRLPVCGAGGAHRSDPRAVRDCALRARRVGRAGCDAQAPRALGGPAETATRGPPAQVRTPCAARARRAPCTCRR